ncbi:hypothetical protein HZS_6357 [Henneguya salminicola]|nr:hypothetical protein HZS_6357 [Henneguya salminicola]
MEKDLFSSQHLVNLIFLARARTFALIPPSNQFLKFSTSYLLFTENTKIEKLRSSAEEFETMSEKISKSHAKLPCGILRRHLSIHLCFVIRVDH